MRSVDLATYEDTQPVAARFFQQALRSQSLAHAYVLKGQALASMYRFSLGLSQVLNCTAKPTDTVACGECQQCKWTADNANPAVMTVSRLTCVADDKGEPLGEDALKKHFSKTSSPKNITTGSVRWMMRQVALSSNVARVVIFTDFEESPVSDHPSDIVPPVEWTNRVDASVVQLLVRPLSPVIFNQASANRFLKTLEEPPPNTLFLFLTDAEENLLATIRSRCQVVPFAAEVDPAALMVNEAETKVLSPVLAQLLGGADVYQVQEVLNTSVIDALGLTPVQLLDRLQRLLRLDFVRQPAIEKDFMRYRTQQQLVESARQKLTAKTHPEHTLNDLLFQLQRVG